MAIRPFNIIIAAAAAMLAAGCAASRHAAENGLKVNPSPYAVMPDAVGNVDIDMQFEVPSRYLGRRERIVLLPKIVKDTTVMAEMSPIAIDAPIYVKKMERLEVLEDWQDTSIAYRRALDKLSDTLLIPYRNTVCLRDMADGTRIRLFVTSDGCGSCRALDTLDLGGITDPSVLLTDTMKVRALEPVFVIRPKFREGKGEARLQFRINRSEIDFSIGRNSAEMANMLAALQPVFSDSLATLTGVSISGMASADGSLPFNTRLAEARATSARNWLISHLDGLTRPQRRVFKVGSRPEGWYPVLAAMKAADDKDSVLVKEILEKYADSNDDVQERYIRRLPCWNNIKNNYLQKDRKVEYVYTYSIKSFTTDEEMLQMYSTRPDAFNEEELLRVSTLKHDPQEKMEVYRTILRYYPGSQVAANNIALMLREEGRTEEAAQVLTGIGRYRQETKNTFAVVRAALGETEAAMVMLGECDTLPEARYNLGMLKASVRDFAAADSLVRPFGDLNAAILAVCVEDYEGADAVLDSLEDWSARAEYVRAMVAASLRDEEAFFTHLDAAVTEEWLKKRAAADAYFDIYRDDERFNMIMGE